MARTCGTVTCDSSTNVMKSSGKNRTRCPESIPAAFRKRPAVVFHAGAMSNFGKHFQVESRPRRKSLGFQEFSLTLKKFQLLLQFVADDLERPLDPVSGITKCLAG